MITKANSSDLFPLRLPLAQRQQPGMRSILLLALALAACAAVASGACEGNACKEQQEAARAAGLLGGTATQLRSCQKKTYPTQGSIGVVGAPPGCHT